MNWGNLLLQFFLYYISTVYSGILLNIPKRTYHTAGMIGGGVWVAYWIVCYCNGIGLAFSNLVATILISVLSQVVVRRKRMSIIVLNVPTLVPFVPGGQAYKMVRNFTIGNCHLVNVYFYQVVAIVGAITLGFGLGELLNRILNYLHRYLIKESRWNF